MKWILSKLLWLVVRLFGEPENIRKREQSKIDAAVTSGSADDVNVLLDDSLKRLRYKSNRDGD